MNALATNGLPRLELHLLGEFRATLNGEPLQAFRADSARGLLAFLAMHRGVAYRREMLATLFWGERDQESALVNLRQILAILRRVLGDANATHPFLEITPRTVTLNPEPKVWVDVNRFRELAMSDNGAGRVPTPLLGTVRVKQALALYRGDFLSDLNVPSSAFDQWRIQEREHLHQRALDLLYFLTRYYERRGDSEMVKYYALRQLELEPWCEEAYAELMLAYTQLGQRSAALKQYALCQRALLSAFGIQPAAKIKTLYRKMAEGDAAGIESERVLPAPHNLPDSIAPFEDQSVAALEEQLLSPQARLVTLVGAGKTPLALAVADVLRGSFDDGVWFISWANENKAIDAEQFLARICSVLKLECSALPADRQANSLRTHLFDQITDKKMLLVLDSIESIRETAAPIVLELLGAAPHLVILATLQEPPELNLESVNYLEA